MSLTELRRTGEGPVRRRGGACVEEVGGACDEEGGGAYVRDQRSTAVRHNPGFDWFFFPVAVDSGNLQ